MKTEKLTPVEWLLNELDQRDMIDKTIYHEKDRTFDSISEEALKMEASQSKWISVEDLEKLKRMIEIRILSTELGLEKYYLNKIECEIIRDNNSFLMKIFHDLSSILSTPPPPASEKK